MQIIAYRKNGAASNVERVFLFKDSGAAAGTEGDPITGLAFNSSGLNISTIANNEAAPNTDTSAATSSIETIATLGTYAAPTAGFVRFREVDATDTPGLYEIQWEDARYAVSNAIWLDISISGVADLAPYHGRIYLKALPADAVAISGDTVAADNLEAGWDGVTGVIGDEFPAKQSQVSNLTVAGSASKIPAKLSPNGFVITWGENEVNNEDVTRAFNGVTHDIEAQDDAGTQRIDAYYESVSIGAGVPSEVTWHGRLDRGGGATKNIVVQVQDVDLSTWRTVSGPEGIQSSASSETHTFDVFINEVGTGADLGKVRTRFLTGSVAFSATTTLHTDQIFTSFNAGSISNLDAVHFDSTASNTGTTSNDGVPGNPVSTEAAVNTLLTARKLHKVSVAIGSDVTFGTNHTGEEWKGDLWTLGLGGRVLASCLFIGATVNGVHTGVSRFEKCELQNISTAGMTTDNCGQDGTITITAPGTYIFNNNHSEISGANTPIIDMGALVGNVDLAMPDYHNGIELRNFNATGTDEFSISGIGQIIYAASCSGTVQQRGPWKETNTGGVTIVRDLTSQNIIDIKVPTDQMVFTKTNELDVNTKSINEAEVTGDGNATPWNGV